MSSRASAVLTGVALLVGLGAASPAAANFVAAGEDPAGDSVDQNPGRDIIAVALNYDRSTGHLQGGVRLRGSGRDAPANLTLFAGHRTATGCNGYPAIGFGTQTDLTGAAWVRLDDSATPPSATGRATKLHETVAEEYEATAVALVGERPNCVVAQLNEPGNPAAVYDVAGPYTLHKRPELEARLGKLPPTMKPAQTRTIRLTLRNLGDASTGRVRLVASKARGMTVRMPRTVRALRPGERRIIPVKVTLSRQARTTSVLRLSASATSGLRARDEGRLYLRKPAASSGSASGNSSQLCYRYTWMPPYGHLVFC